MDQHDLLKLVVNAQAGDKGSMEQIITRFEPLLRKICSEVDYHERNELIQHVREKIIRSVQSYKFTSIPNHDHFFSLMEEWIKEQSQ
ncbi:helix-turn-helix domain-containing protein [Paenibacillus camelliae]|uniref:helix-turn-helix domain-containing protein n=1 Tax=Paenibacillus camelliae TaxID=512410 RepID=UPI00203B1DF8|nr:helix-turn-helix domain-containing protein [Paenibacillus camelliae]MCM3635883.1 helix-turn-helix domain-containing protein [Paenibacillus camelliae]